MNRQRRRPLPHSLQGHQVCVRCHYIPYIRSTPTMVPNIPLKRDIFSPLAAFCFEPRHLPPPLLRSLLEISLVVVNFFPPPTCYAG